MSSSQYLARLVVGSSSFYFVAWDTDRGQVPTSLELIDEELRAGGVDGVRYLDDHLEFVEFTARTDEDADSYASAVALADAYQDAQGLYGTLTLNNSGGQRTFKNLKIRKVMPKAITSTTFGFGAGATSGGCCHAEWQLVLTEL